MALSNVIIRPYGSEDKEKVLALHQQVFEGGVLSRELYSSTVHSRLEKQLSASQTMVAEDLGKIVGLSAFRLWNCDKLGAGKSFLRHSRALPGTPQFPKYRANLEKWFYDQAIGLAEGETSLRPPEIQYFANPITLSSFEPDDQETRAAIGTDLVVAQEYRRRGLGRELLSSLLTLADRGGVFYIQTECTEEGVRVCEGLRFMPLLQIKPYYDNGSSVIFMGRSFP